MINATELRSKVGQMTKPEMAILRDELESNWSETLRPLMDILALGCISKFKTTITRL